MSPLSARMTSGEPPLAQSIAHCLLAGLVRPLVKAHAESRTKPFTVTVELSAAVRYIAVARPRILNVAVALFMGFAPSEHSTIRRTLGKWEPSSYRSGLGTMAITRTGLPEPFTIFSGAAITIAPVTGS